MGKPIIGYENFFADGVLAADSETVGGEKEKAVDGFLFDGWKPGTGAGFRTLDTDLGVVGLTWDFTNTVDGWTPTNCTLTPGATAVVLDSTANDPAIRRTGLSFDGNTHRYVMVRIKRTAGSTWDGTLFYMTPTHADSTLFRRGKTPDPTTIGVWTVLTYDMHDLTGVGSEGDDDWRNNIITALRFDFGAATGDNFEIDWIAVIKNPFADYWAMFSRDFWSTSLELAPHGGPRIEFSDDNLVTTVSFDTITDQTGSPTLNRNILFRKKPLSAAHRWWRFAFDPLDTEPAPTIQIIQLGKRLDFDADAKGRFGPPNLQSNAETIVTVSQTGQNLGQSTINTGMQIKADFNLVTPAWARTNWPAFRTHANKKSFFFSWNHADFPDEAAFVWLDDKATRDPAHTHPLFMSLTLAMNGLRE